MGGVPESGGRQGDETGTPPMSASIRCDPGLPWGWRLPDARASNDPVGLPRATIFVRRSRTGHSRHMLSPCSHPSRRRLHSSVILLAPTPGGWHEASLCGVLPHIPGGQDRGEIDRDRTDRPVFVVACLRIAAHRRDRPYSRALRSDRQNPGLSIDARRCRGRVCGNDRSPRGLAAGPAAASDEPRCRLCGAVAFATPRPVCRLAAARGARRPADP